MSGIIGHQWGKSAPVDRIWARVVGLRPSERSGRLFMVFQAYIDDSWDQETDGHYVLAGYIATAEQWAKFSSEWEEILPLGRLNKDGGREFKMSQMQNDLTNVAAFYRVIENNVSAAISLSFKRSDIVRAKARIFAENTEIDWGDMEYDFVVGFSSLMNLFHSMDSELLEKMLPGKPKVSFIFDSQSEKSVIIKGWDRYWGTLSPTRKARMGATPSFEDGREFLPLQAADFWAWWVRRWANAGLGINMDHYDFGGWKADARRFPRLYVSLSEDELAKNLQNGLFEQTGRPALDINRFSFSTNATGRFGT